MRQTLRAYQARAIQALRDKLRSHRRLLLVSPTGSGKTTIAAEMIHGATSRGRRVLFLAHRKELIDQCSARLDQFAVPHGVIMAGHKRYQPLLPVQVASVPTLVRRPKPDAQLIVIDEAHHARAGTYQQILDAYPGVPTIGLSATPWRTDGKGLGELFEDVVVAATIQELTKQGYLVPATGFAYDAPELSQVHRRGGDYQSDELELVMGGSAIAGNVVQSYLQHAAGKRAVLFAVSVKHSRDLVSRFQAEGVAAEHLDGTTPKEEREEILQRLTSGETTLVSNVGVLTEGWDCPAVEVCILARPTLSVGLYMQMVGRALRPAPGKTVARIHDHAGCVLMHGRPDRERDYSLTADVRVTKKAERDALPLRCCDKCFAVYDATARSCPECGGVNTQRRPPREVRATRRIPLEEIREIPMAQKRAVFERLQATCEAKGYKRGWVAHRYRARFGEWPPRTWENAA